MEVLNTKVVTGKVRFSFVNVFEPKAFADQEPKYSVMLMIPKSDVGTVAKIKAAIDNAAKKGLTTKFGGKMPTVLKTTFKDADKDTNMDGDVLSSVYPETAGHYVINVSSKTQPKVIDLYGNPIIDPTELYSGCYGRASINFYAYAQQGNKGISAGLGNLQKLDEGEPLGSVSSPTSDFADTIQQ